MNEMSTKKKNSISFQKIQDIFISINDKVLSRMEKYFTSSIINKSFPINYVFFICKER